MRHGIVINGYNIEPGGCLFPPLKKSLSGHYQLLLFSGIHRLKTLAVSGVFPGLHFHENRASVLESDDVYLSEPAPEIFFQNFISVLNQIFFGFLLAFLPDPRNQMKFPQKLTLCRGVRPNCFMASVCFFVP